MDDVTMEDAPTAGTDVVSEEQNMPYIDRLLSTAGLGEEDEEFVLLDGDESGDVELEYDSDESSVRVRIEGYEPPTSGDQRDLSEEGKQKLSWRLGKEQSFSDWTIEVSVEGKEAEPQPYHVHRVALAVGPTKCDYFDALFSSGQFRESIDNTSRVKVPDQVASSFPDFLDFFYAPPSERECAITARNALALRYLANYFIAPTLNAAVKDFIKEDMYHLENLQAYLFEFAQPDDDDDDAKEMMASAGSVCAEMIFSIEEDSSLLFGMPPAFFLQIITSTRSTGDVQSMPGIIQKHICDLVISYIRHFKYELDELFFTALTSSLYFPDDETEAGLVAIDLLEIIKDTGWQKDDDGILHIPCIYALSKYLSIGNPTVDQIRNIMEKIPPRAVAALFKDALKRQELNSIVVSFKVMSSALWPPDGTIVSLELKSSDSFGYIKYLIDRRLGSLHLRILIFGVGSVELLDDHTLSDYNIMSGSEFFICGATEKVEQMSNGTVVVTDSRNGTVVVTVSPR